MEQLPGIFIWRVGKLCTKVHRIIDAHIHLDQFSDKELPEFYNSMKRVNCSHVVAVGSDLASSGRILDLSHKHDWVIPAAGFHPEQSIPSKEEVDKLCVWIVEHEADIAAIGEIGLPTYLLRERQDTNILPYIELLERLLNLAKKLDKPVALHAVHAEADIVCDLLEKADIENAHFHWFKGSKATMKRMMNRGYFISLPPEIVYRQKIRDIAKLYPLNLMMAETDGPWPFDGPFKGIPTHPEMIHAIIESIAEIGRAHV